MSFVRCLDCGLIGPSTTQGLCKVCRPKQEWDEDDDFPDSGAVIKSMFPVKETKDLIPNEDCGEPIEGSYVLCLGRRLVSDDPDLDKDWEGYGPPLSLSAY